MKRTSLARLAACCLLTPVAGAQLAVSAGFALEGYELDAAGGELCSIGHASFAALDALGSAGLASPNFAAEVGFVGAFDSGPTLLPVVFGVAPFFGPMEGGTPIAISGQNFDKLGAAGPITVDVGGSPATGVSVSSDTQILAFSPAAEPGPQPVQVSGSFGSGSLPGGFLFTPAVIASSSALIGGPLEFTHYGPAGFLYQLYFSPFQTSIPLPDLGTLLIGPTNVFALGPVGVYLAPDGIDEFGIVVPPDPTLQGVTLHFQDVAVLGFTPLVTQLTNRSSTLLL